MGNLCILLHFDVNLKLLKKKKVLILKKDASCERLGESDHKGISHLFGEESRGR